MISDTTLEAIAKVLTHHHISGPVEIHVDKERESVIDLRGGDKPSATPDFEILERDLRTVVETTRGTLFAFILRESRRAIRFQKTAVATSATR